MRLTCEVLGEVTAQGDGRPVDLGSPQQRALFGLFLLSGGRPMSTDQLIERMWGPGIEKKLRSTLRTYVLRLRRAFVDVGITDPVIETLSYGYRFVADGSVDLTVFGEHLARGRAARESGDLVTAAELFRTALSRWRGTPLSGARAFFVEEEQTRLRQVHVAALEDRIQLDLDLGHDTALESELLELVKLHPLRERLHEFLMVTLYRGGRQADALAAYQRVRRILNDELGVAPGPGLQDTLRRILRSDPGLLRSSVAIREPVSTAPLSISELTVARHQLPADTPDFTGRADLIARLDRLLTGEHGPDLVGLCGLDGMGKTTLAVRAAHRVMERFPDGQFYADLRGSTDRPVPVGDVLGRFLRATGLAGDIPDDDEERAFLWRSCLVGRRVLVILDDAATADQVRQLLPATAGSSAIVTAVRRFEATALHWERVGPLSRAESETLLDTIVGPGPRAAEPGPCAGILDIASGYPELIRLAGHRIKDRPNWSVSSVFEQLRDNADDPTGIHPNCRRIRGAVERSMTLVEPEIQRAFRLIASAQVATFTPESVAALLDVSPARAMAILHELTEVHLLGCGQCGAFDMITPVRTYARANTRELDRPEDVRTAVDRMRSFYRETDSNARMWHDIERSVDALEHQTQHRGGLRFVDRDSADRWLGDYAIDVRMLTEQSGQFSPAHAPAGASELVRAPFSAVRERGAGTDP